MAVATSPGWRACSNLQQVVTVKGIHSPRRGDTVGPNVVIPNMV